MEFLKLTNSPSRNLAGTHPGQTMGLGTLEPTGSTASLLFLCHSHATFSNRWGNALLTHGHYTAHGRGTNSPIDRREVSLPPQKVCACVKNSIASLTLLNSWSHSTWQAQVHSQHLSLFYTAPSIWLKTLTITVLIPAQYAHYEPYSTYPSILSPIHNYFPGLPAPQSLLLPLQSRWGRSNFKFLSLFLSQFVRLLLSHCISYIP